MQEKFHLKEFSLSSEQGTVVPPPPTPVMSCLIFSTRVQDLFLLTLHPLQAICLSFPRSFLVSQWLGILGPQGIPYQACSAPNPTAVLHWCTLSTWWHCRSESESLSVIPRPQYSVGWWAPLAQSESIAPSR